MIVFSDAAGGQNKNWTGVICLLKSNISFLYVGTAFACVTVILYIWKHGEETRDSNIIQDIFNHVFDLS